MRQVNKPIARLSGQGPTATPGFPGTNYDADGRSLNPTLPGLRQGDLDAYPHRCLVTDRGTAPMARF